MSVEKEVEGIHNGIGCVVVLLAILTATVIICCVETICRLNDIKAAIGGIRSEMTTKKE